MLVYYDTTTGAAQYTMKGDPATAPAGVFIEVPDNTQIPDITAMSVVEGTLVFSEEVARPQWRNTASITKRQLFLELKQREHLTASDAILAAKGEWPTVLTPFLDQLRQFDPSVVEDLEIEFAGSIYMDRLDPGVLTFQSELGISDHEADDIFGWSP